ncbi:MAG: hypothetical protein CMH55_11305, partial [Myxococcales bacterium]|nr:hypothetical protein [Myxococcales bacterium]
MVISSPVPYDDQEVASADRPAGCEGPGNCRWDDGDVPLDPVPYFLRFLIEGADDAVFNNHVPLDPISKRIKVTRRPDRRRASTGDIVTFMVEVSNGSSTAIDPNLDGGPRLLDILPPSLAPVGGEALVIHGVDGSDRRLSAPVATLTGGIRELTDWVLLPGERLTWTYRATVLPGAPLGPSDSSNRLLTRSSAVPLADLAHAQIELVPDAFLEESTLIGRAYCDADGNGRFDARELGVPGIRLYADHGVWVETDGYGRYHFSRLGPGIHRVKIDERSLPAGASIADPGRTFELTPGLPIAVDFPLACDLKLHGPEELARNPMADVRRAPPPPMTIPPLAVVADPTEGVLMVQERVLEVPQVRAGVFGPAEDVDMMRTTGPNLGFHETTLHLYARASGPLPMARWTWRLQTETGRTVLEKSGDGAPPAKLVVDLPDGLKRNQMYQAWLEVEAVGGDRASSRLLPVGLGIGMEPPRKRRPSVLDESNGRLFVDDGATPTPRFRGWFQDRVSRLQGDPELVVEIQVHGQAAKGRVKATVYTARRAQTIKGMLLAAGIATKRFRVRSMGAKRKVVPNRTKAMMRKNRRVEIRFKRVRSAAEPVDLGVEVVPQLLINGREMARNAEGRFEGSLELGVGDQAVMDLITERGGRIRVARRRHLDGLEVLPQRARGLDGLAVSGRLRGLDRSLKVGAKELDLDLLSVRIRPLVRAVKLNADGTGLEPIKNADGSIACPGICVGVTTGYAPESWELRIRQASDVGFDKGLDEAVVIHALKGVGPVPKVLPWNGVGGGSVFILREGIYGLQLILRGKGGHTAISAPSFFRVYRPEGDFRVVLPDPFGKPSRKGKLGKLKLSPDARRDLERFIALSKVLQGNVTVFGHTDLTVRATKAEGVTKSMAESIRQELVRGGIEPGRIMVKAQGNSDRLILKARKASEHAKNRRVELRLSPEQIEALPDLPLGMAVARAPGGDLVADEEGSVEGRLLPGKSGKIVLRLEDGSGRSAVYPLRSETLASPAVEPMYPVLPVLEGSAQDMLATDAASLLVALPPAGTIHRHTSIGVFGRTLPNVKVTVNGKAATVHPLTGAFGINLNMKPGDQEIEVVAEDAGGSRARLSRKVRIEPHGWFLMGLADLAYGTPSVPLAGARGDRTLDMGRWGRLTARTMAWYKRSWTFPKTSHFRRLDLSTYVDSDRWGFLEYERLWDDGRQAREYGDDAKEVQEVKAAGPLYLSVVADDSYLKIANFKTKQPGRKLLNYQRSFYGFDGLYARSTGPKKEARRVEAGMYASTTAQGLRAASNLFVGTGGSFYRLRHGDLLAGSERVRMIVREQMTGLSLAERLLIRGKDYRVDAVEGL